MSQRNFVITLRICRFMVSEYKTIFVIKSLFGALLNRNDINLTCVKSSKQKLMKEVHKTMNHSNSWLV